MKTMCVPINILLFIYALSIANACTLHDTGSGDRRNSPLHREGNDLIRYVLYDNGKLKMLKHYTLDTIPNGAEVHYYTNGEIMKWLWFDASKRDSIHKYAQYGVYFDSSGNYLYHRGMPFLSAFKITDSTLAIEITNPPGINYLFGYIEQNNNAIIRRLIKEPGKTDTTSWVTIPYPNFKNGNQHFTCFYIIDKSEKKLDSLCQELFP